MPKRNQLSRDQSIFIVAFVVIAILFQSMPKEKCEEYEEYIVLTSTRNGNYEIYSMKPDGSELRRLTYNQFDDYNPSISPDGQRIAFVSHRDGDYEIYIMNFDGSNQTRVTHSVGGDDFPAWSPDGKRIAFTSWRDDNSEIYVMNVDGTNQVNLTNNPADDVVPAWSPDGNRMIFESSRGDDNHPHEPILYLYTMNANGTNTQLLVGTEARWPAWSPDGRKIAFISHQGIPAELHILEPASHLDKALDINMEMDGKVVWSPNGEEILFNSYINNSRGEIYRVGAAGSNPIQLTSGDDANSSADWKRRCAPHPQDG